MYYIPSKPSKANSELVAVCLFSKTTKTVEFRNYDKYYTKRK